MPISFLNHSAQPEAALSWDSIAPDGMPYLGFAQSKECVQSKKQIRIRSGSQRNRASNRRGSENRQPQALTEDRPPDR